LSLEIIRFDSDIESRAIEILEMYY
jgi:hypothetical protein